MPLKQKYRSINLLIPGLSHCRNVHVWLRDPLQTWILHSGGLFHLGSVLYRDPPQNEVTVEQFFHTVFPMRAHPQAAGSITCLPVGMIH